MVRRSRAVRLRPFDRSQRPVSSNGVGCGRNYTDKTLKLLFGASGNECAYEGCTEALVYPDVPAVMGVICHIRGLRPGSARYVDGFDCDELNAYDNLIVLCPTHHRLVDEVELHEWDEKRLFDLRRRHFDRRSTPPLTGDALVVAVELTLLNVAARSTEGVPRPPQVEHANDVEVEIYSAVLGLLYRMKASDPTLEVSALPADERNGKAGWIDIDLGVVLTPPRQSELTAAIFELIEQLGYDVDTAALKINGEHVANRESPSDLRS